MKLLALLLTFALAWGTVGCGGPRGSLPPAAEGGSSPSSSLAGDAPPPPAQEAPPPEESPDPPEAPEAAGPRPEPWPGAMPLVNDYIAGEADRLLREIITPEMDRYQQVQTIYRWLVENTAFFDNQPVGLEVWQWRGDIRQVPGYVENRAISPLLFGIGSCEDYAAAAVVLLRRLGIPAEYVAGLTISVRGDFVDHAWAVVQLDGQWYHIDPQLEDNVTRRGRLTYRFFLKGDQTMAADHRWGENLIAYYGREMTAERAANIREHWRVPACPNSLPPPEPELLDEPPVPDRARVVEELAAERRRWEAEHGPLPPVEMDVTPPVL